MSRPVDALFAELLAKRVDPEIATLEELPVTKMAPPLEFAVFCAKFELLTARIPL
jgi:hypothetical protein